MANIQPYVDDIRNARYGRDVRESIASGLEAMNNESSEAYEVAVTAQNSASAMAQNAATYASNAQESATQASESASTAQGVVSTVNGYKDEAKTFRDEANTSASNARTSADNASTAEANALASANRANTSANNASGSATQASNSATTATDAMRNATASATQAASSAQQASSSQTAAANSATNAKTSENAARQYAEQAQSIVGIGTMSTTKNGIGRPDGETIEVNEFGVFSAKGIREHVANVLNSDNGVHGTRVRDGKLQTWNAETSTWEDAIKTTSDAKDVTFDNAGTTLTSGDVDGALRELNASADSKAPMNVVSDAWNSGTSYDAGEYVIYNNNLWECLVQNVGQEPVEGAYWHRSPLGATITNLKSNLSDLSQLFNPKTSYIGEFVALPMNVETSIYRYVFTRDFVVNGHFRFQVEGLQDGNMIDLTFYHNGKRLWESQEIAKANTARYIKTASIVEAYKAGDVLEAKVYPSTSNMRARIVAEVNYSN